MSLLHVYLFDLLQTTAVMHRYSLDRFKKAQTAEPFSVQNGATVASASGQVRDLAIPSSVNNQFHHQTNTVSKPSEVELSSTQTTSVGGGQSNWQPPDWAVEPRSGLFWLDVMKDGEVVDKIMLEKKRHIFGRQAIMCDFVLDHPSVSRQHAAVVQHKNGRFGFSHLLCER